MRALPPFCRIISSEKNDFTSATAMQSSALSVRAAHPLDLNDSHCKLEKCRRTRARGCMFDARGESERLRDRVARLHPCALMSDCGVGYAASATSAPRGLGWNLQERNKSSVRMFKISLAFLVRCQRQTAHANAGSA